MERIIHFIKQGSVLIESHSNIAIVFLTLGLLYVNWRSTKATDKMAVIAKMQLDSGLRPYIGFENKIEIIAQIDAASGKVSTHTDWIQLRCTFINLGQVPAVKKVVLTSFQNKKINPEYPEIVLYPGQTIEHTTEIFSMPNTKVEELKVKIEIKAIYWGLDNPNKKYFSSREFEISGQDRYLIKKDSAGEFDYS